MAPPRYLHSPPIVFGGSGGLKGSKGKVRWIYPPAWLTPMHWYWSQLAFTAEPESAYNNRGITWIELVIDFELATHTFIQRQRSDKDSSPDSVRTRAQNFNSASRHLLAMAGNPKLPRAQVGTLVPFGARWMWGLPSRPALMAPDQVFIELAHQAMVHRRQFDGDARDSQNHWNWPPGYKRMPPCMWPGDTIPEQTIKRRIRGKQKINDPPPLEAPYVG